jgi:hypothetical protein
MRAIGNLGGALNGHLTNGLLYFMGGCGARPRFHFRVRRFRLRALTRLVNAVTARRSVH